MGSGRSAVWQRATMGPWRSVVRIHSVRPIFPWPASPVDTRDSMNQNPISPANPTTPPTATEKKEIGARTVWWLPCHGAKVEASGFVTGEPTLSLEGHREGRTKHPVYLDDQGSLLMWKRCLRGGWLSHLIKDRHWNPMRFVTEMKLCQQVNQSGIPTSKILAVAASRAGIGFRVELLIELETGVQTLLELLGDPAVSSEQRQLFLDSTSDTIRDFHEHGWLHGDLNLMNVLLQKTGEEEYKAFLVDLDPGGLGPAANRLSNLTRLVRSYRKSRTLGTPSLFPGEGFRFLHRVTGGNRQLLGELLERSRKILNREDWKR